MIVSSTYKNGYTIQLCCIPDIEAKEIEFSVHIFKGSSPYGEPTFEMPGQGYHIFPPGQKPLTSSTSTTQSS